MSEGVLSAGTAQAFSGMIEKNQEMGGDAEIKKRIYYQLPREDTDVLVLALFKCRRVRASERHTRGNTPGVG